MRLRTFNAPTMPAALALVREALGDDAIILSSKEHPHLKQVSVTAAIDEDKLDISRPAPETSSVAADQLRFDSQNTLRFHNIPEHFIAKMLGLLNESTVATVLASGRLNMPNDGKFFLQLALQHICDRLFDYQPIGLNTAPRLMLVGTTGIGKTLAIAKLATQAAMAKQKICIITTDNKRAGGIEQLSAFTNILELPLSVCDSAKALVKEIKSHPKHTALFIDTAGCNPYDSAEMEELSELITASGTEPVLALPAGGDSMETLENTEAFCALPIKRLLITRADSSRRFGNIIASASAQQLAFSNISSSGSVTEPLQAASPKILSALLTRYLLQTS